VSRGGIVSLGGQWVLAAEILGGRRVGSRIEPELLMFYDLSTRELQRTRANPLSLDQVRRLRGRRPGGPPPRPPAEPVRVQRRASNTGVVMVCGQKVAPGRAHRHQTVTIAVSETTLAIELDDGDTRIVRRTTDKAVRNIKSKTDPRTPQSTPSAPPPPSRRPTRATRVTSRPSGCGRFPQFHRPGVNHQLAQKRQGSPGSRHADTAKTALDVAASAAGGLNAVNLVSATSAPPDRSSVARRRRPRGGT
jgi:hypothetical protein